MRPSSYISSPDEKPNWRVVKTLLPYLMEFRGRVALAFSFLICAKLANVAMPWILKHIVDDLDLKGAEAAVVPIGLLLLYGLFRFGTVFLGELRDAVFARVTERAMRRVGLKVFKHLHDLDLDFHLGRKTGGLSRDIERGTSGISFLMRFMLFNILPTIFEISLVAFILLGQFSYTFAIGIVLSVVAYIGFSVVVTEWRNKYVRAVNEQDNRSNTRAVDSLLNYETVKYFNNEAYEANEYDQHLKDWEDSRLKNRLTLTGLNSGQALIIAVAVTSMMIVAAKGVVGGSMTLGDFVMINAYMIQLFIPLNFLGFVYREIRQALINIEKMFQLLEVDPQVKNSPNAQPVLERADKQFDIEFKDVYFQYHADRPILRGVNFTINAGEKVAVVGHSGAGKSTIAKLLFRFYDVSNGSVLINGMDIRDMDLAQVRKLMGVVPQDTVLFNDSIFYNIAYGNPKATEEEVLKAARDAHLLEFIQQLPNGMKTVVGERGLKVSGGEKQRIALARVLLKNPPILIFDEATSSLDTYSEKIITKALDEMAQTHTTLVIAHRLSTIMNADRIVVLEKGQVVEVGDHETLLAKNSVYADLWQSQNKKSKEIEKDSDGAHFIAE